VTFGDIDGKPFSVAKIAAYMRVPRTTVRRRLDQLQRWGLIDRQGRRYWHADSTTSLLCPARLDPLRARRAVWEICNALPQVRVRRPLPGDSDGKGKEMRRISAATENLFGGGADHEFGPMPRGPGTGLAPSLRRRGWMLPPPGADRVALPYRAEPTRKAAGASFGLPYVL
jgi:hypothetical protein